MIIVLVPPIYIENQEVTGEEKLFNIKLLFFYFSDLCTQYCVSNREFLKTQKIPKLSLNYFCY